MRGFSTAFWMWLPVLIGKLIKGMWTLCASILAGLCGVPLYYCRQPYRILGQLIGGFGLLCFTSGLGSLTMGSVGETLSSSLITLAVGVISLLASRSIIRRGALG